MLLISGLQQILAEITPLHHLPNTRDDVLQEIFIWKYFIFSWDREDYRQRLQRLPHTLAMMLHVVSEIFTTNKNQPQKVVKKQLNKT